MPIVIKRPDGGVSICHPSKEDFFDEALRRSQLLGECSIISAEDLPKDRSFRNAWTHDGLKVIECPIKSRDIVRAKRNKKLEELDVIAIRESRKPNGRIQEIDSKAEMLRNIPQRENFEVLSIEELKAILVEIDSLGDK